MGLFNRQELEKLRWQERSHFDYWARAAPLAAASWMAPDVTLSLPKGSLPADWEEEIPRLCNGSRLHRDDMWKVVHQE